MRLDLNNPKIRELMQSQAVPPVAAHTQFVPTPTELAKDRGLSFVQVLRHLRSSELWSSITEIRQHVNLSRPTLTSVTATMAEMGVLQAKTAALASRQGGRPPLLYRLNPNHHCLLLLRVGYRECSAELLDATGTALTRVAVAFEDTEDAVSALVEAARKARQIECKQLAAAVVTVMGIVNENRVITSKRFPQLDGNEWIAQVREVIGQGTPLLVRNDAKLAALWMDDHLRSNGRFPRSNIGLHCSEDLGCAIVMSGRILEGAHGAAGEVTLDANGGWKKCSRRIRAAETRFGIGIRAVFQAAQAGDQAAREFVTELSNEVGQALSPLVLAVDPEVVTIGGAYVDAGEVIAERIDAHLQAISPTPPEVLLATPGESCVMRGAKKTAMDFVDNLIAFQLLQGN